ncbi:hypothetical protein GCM10020331_010510 [Ectobacillus funiculus]
MKKNTGKRLKNFIRKKIPEFAIVAGYIKASILDKAKREAVKEVL